MGTVPGTDDGNGSRRAEVGPILDAALVGDIEGVPAEDRWLVDRLWSASGVGILGATPKSGKTWLSLELAVAVASGTPALGEFAVPAAGPVVVFPAEDDRRAVRDRVAGLAAARDVELADLPLHLVTANTLHLDNESDRRGLEGLLRRVRPSLVVLDPLVRLHGGDENYAGHIAEVLGFLRGLQREFDCAILLTHHVSKRRGSKGSQMGQALRGSGELHAWGDSNLYLNRLEQGLVRVEVEHRSAAPPDPFCFRMVAKKEGTHLVFTEDIELEEGDEEAQPARRRKRVGKEQVLAPAAPLRERVLEVVGEKEAPTPQTVLRRLLGVRNQALTEALRELQAEGAVERAGHRAGWFRV